MPRKLPYSELGRREKDMENTKHKRWCVKNPEKRAAYRHKHYMENRGKYLELERERYYLRTYGISLADYNAMFSKQNGGCAICGSPILGKVKKGWLAVDHCHVTGEVRGLLCTRCNVSLGWFEQHRHAGERYLKHGPEEEWYGQV